MYAVLVVMGMSAVEIEVKPTVAPLSRLVPMLAEVSGWKLRLESSVADDVVAIASPKRPVREVLDAVAKAVNGTWSDRPDGWVLLRTRAQELEDEQRDIAFRAGWMRKSIGEIPIDKPFGPAEAAALADYRYEFKKKTDITPTESNQLPVLNARSPIGRFGRRLLDAFGPERLAAIPLGQRVVFSSRPNKMQLSFGIKNLDALTRQFTHEQNLYAGAVRKLGESKNTMTYVSGFDTVQAIPEKMDRLLMAVNSTSPFQTTMTIKFLDADGNELVLVRPTVTRALMPHLSQPTAKDPIIAFEQNSIEFLKTRNTTKPIPESITKTYFDLTKREPLEMVHKEAIATWSKNEGKPVVASLHDVLLATSLQPPYKLRQYRDTLAFWGFDADETESGVIIRPGDPVQNRSRRVDRKIIGEFAASYRRLGYISLESMIRFSLVTERPTFTSGLNILRILGCSVREPQDLQMLKVIALADPVVRNRLLEGGWLPVAALPTALQKVLANILYSTERPNFIADRRSFENYEPTLAFPNGMPSTAVLSTEFLDRPAVRFSVKNAGVPDWLPVADAETLAINFLSRNPSPPQEFQFGKQRSLHMKLTPLGMGNAIQQSWNEDAIPVASQWVKFESLPAEFKAKVQATLDKASPPQR